MSLHGPGSQPVARPTELSENDTIRRGPNVAATTLMPWVSFSRVQAIVGTIAGTLSIAMTAFSLAGSVRPPATGHLVMVLQATGSRGRVSDATVEVLTRENALVATLTPDATGRVSQPLSEGDYVVRVSHPRYAPEVRRVHVVANQTVEMRTTLTPGSSSPIKRAVSGGAGAVRKVFGF